MRQPGILGFLKRATYRSARVEEYCVSLERNGITERNQLLNIPLPGGSKDSNDTVTGITTHLPGGKQAGYKPVEYRRGFDCGGFQGEAGNPPPPRVELQDAIWAAVRKRGSA